MIGISVVQNLLWPALYGLFLWLKHSEKGTKQKFHFCKTVSHLPKKEIFDISFLPCNIENPTVASKFLISYI